MKQQRNYSKNWFRTGVILVVFLILAVLPVAGDSMQKENGIDRTGGSYSKIVIAGNNPDDCAQACVADSRCLAATYVKPGTFQGPEAWCWLKDSVPASSANPDCITFLRRGGIMQPPLEAKKVMITQDPSWKQKSPQISGNYLIWTGQPPEGGSTYYQVYLYDITAGKKTQLTDDPFSHSVEDLDDGRVLWSDQTGIVLFSLFNRQRNIVMPAPVDKTECPRISGNYVTWRDTRNVTMSIKGHSNHGLYAVWSGSPEIYLRDLTTNSDTRLAENDYDKGCPAVSGTSVAWIELRNGTGYLVLYDTRTGARNQIKTDIHETVALQIRGSRIFWSKGQNISYYDIGTGAREQISWKPLHHYGFTVSENLVIWDGWYHTGNGLEVYDTATGTIRLINDSFEVYYPVADRHSVAGVLWDPAVQGGTGNIVLFTLPDQQSPVSPAGSPSIPVTSEPIKTPGFSALAAAGCASALMLFLRGKRQRNERRR